MDTLDLILVVLVGLVGPGGIATLLTRFFIGKVNEKDKTIGKLQERVTELEEQQKKVPILEQQVATLIGELQDLRGRLDNKEELLKRAEADRDRLKTDVQTKDQLIAALNVRIASYERALELLGVERAGMAEKADDSMESR